MLWTDEAHFHFQGSVSTQNCRIWTRDNPFQMQPLPLHSQNVTMWRWLMAAFIAGPSGPVTCTVNGHVMNLFCATSSFQHCNCADVWIAQFLCKMALLRTLQHQ
ncbi:hypothetical protein AVEN_107092-1 [Araneus ventricosus]|uniref:Uncharacterized protein n=1 Tax=Araneus ventricosus TaxID=182803 RepID=A0A4Y2RR30_ARAVE|nr:hypothetical protein AVEN_107092-1 [Araneus ventricosus]